MRLTLGLAEGTRHAPGILRRLSAAIMLVTAAISVAAADPAARVLKGETACGTITLRGDFAGRADIVVITHRTDCETARRVARRAASRPTRFGQRTPAPAGWTCMASFRPSLGYVLRHAVTCQRGASLKSINRPAVAISLPAAPSGACGTVRVDMRLHADPHGPFGAFGIVAHGVRCEPARTLASAYVQRPAAPLHTTKVNGWTCAATPSRNRSQAFEVRCTVPGATVAFQDRVPNG